MKTGTRRMMAAGMVGVGVLLGVVATAPAVSWGLGCAVAAGLIAGGLTVRVGAVRPYDHARDGA